MKKILFFLIFCLSVSAKAENVKTAVGTFVGSVRVDTSRLDIKEVSVEVVNEFCKLWGSTCVGGPKESEKIPVIIEEKEDGKIITITNENDYRVSTTRIGHRFNSCKIVLNIEAVNSEGKQINGSSYLVSKNNKDACSKKEDITKEVQETLNKNLSVEDGELFVRIKE